MLDGMRPIPLRPDPAALVARNVTALSRAVIAKAAARIDRRSDDATILRRSDHYPFHDEFPRR
jgi:hypothetical protein